MPNKYIRIAEHKRGNWTQEQLTKALEAIKNDNMSIYRAASLYGVPRKTLERRFKQNKFLKGGLGPGCTFGYDNERRLANHIIRMQSMGFTFTKNDLRIIAYKFAQHFGIRHKFNEEKQKAGYDFINGFLSRNQDIKISRSEAISSAPNQDKNHSDMNDFGLFNNTLTESNSLNSSLSIYSLNSKYNDENTVKSEQIETESDLFEEESITIKREDIESK
ncbi:uncharacterized protein [Chelonus insularis]|uniref:uncharacterized protein n=1 Tax=Chelonus insularis TaxID=460826 RepID=UPI00158D5342|nr:uncharacterized protein LOC118072442 [Chelonus insularis]